MCVPISAGPSPPQPECTKTTLTYHRKNRNHSGQQKAGMKHKAHRTNTNTINTYLKTSELPTRQAADRDLLRMYSKAVLTAVSTWFWLVLNQQRPLNYTCWASRASGKCLHDSEGQLCQMRLFANPTPMSTDKSRCRFRSCNFGLNDWKHTRNRLDKNTPHRQGHSLCCHARCCWPGRQERCLILVYACPVGLQPPSNIKRITLPVMRKLIPLQVLDTNPRGLN